MVDAELPRSADVHPTLPSVLGISYKLVNLIYSQCLFMNMIALAHNAEEFKINVLLLMDWNKSCLFYEIFFMKQLCTFLVFNF